ncbi:type II toxin-antitoxin system ParD family antitoxin [Rhizobium sp. AQ_MP]|uniref:type II toxin-antitoxin system ParD family antitoxin n=1 Tax=Rhizobium sp. AQ_MP TaxID=2761536 RepID=UPI0016395A86|nr:type II toxin-antitoxin system ParD family antitoxin [Rhizobium sp. AQ_MP]MBC2774391.1 type II toxin-antitoxin system ParD family antitoxin [Rhizobium sp. AQ_MP]
MQGITIAIPDDLKDWVSRKTESGEYADPSDYVSGLIRQDQERAAKIEAMQKAVDAGLASGVGNRTADQLFQAAKQKANP